MLCVSEECFLGLASETPFGMAIIVAVCVRSVLALPPFLCHCRDQVAWLAGWLAAVGSPSPLSSYAKSAAYPTFWSLCNNRKQCGRVF